VVDITQTPTYLELIQETEPDFDDLLVKEKLKNETLAQLELLKSEVASYSIPLSNNPSIIVFSKSDLPHVKETFESVETELIDTFLISSGSRYNLGETMEGMWTKLGK
jgi:GTPase involved in cell partitioning and DNA repair